MTATAIGPIQGDLHVFLDTDNPFDFSIVDEDGERIDVTGWTADFEVDKSSSFDDVKLTVEASVIPDPDDAMKTVLHVDLTDDLLQPGTDDDQWPVNSASSKKYPYSLKRTNDGFEKVLRYGWFVVHRARV